MTARRHTPRRSRLLVGGLVLVLASAGCGGGGEEAGSGKDTVPAARVCGGLSARSAQALEQISETKAFTSRSHGTAPAL